MIARHLATVAVAALLASCAPPTIESRVTPVAPASLGLGAAAPAITERWWAAFGDAQLDRIMDDALGGSPTLAAALARVRVAEAALTRGEASRRPQVDFAAQEQRVRLSDRYTIPPPFAGSTQWVGTAQLNLGWTIDFWGRQRATVEQARGSARAASLDAAAARLALTGSIAQTYVELVRAERLADIAAQFVRSREESVRLVDSRIRNELASQFDARAAGALLIEARQAELRARNQREIVVNALAALARRGAEYAATIAPARLDLAAGLPLPTSLPADLLGRRPDLLAGLARIDAAAAGRTVARTAYYPNVDLLAFAGFQAIGLGALASGGALTAGAGPSIHLPIFTGGRLRADLAGATAQLDVATADYNSAVLRAVRETADAVARVRTLAADDAEQQRLVAALEDVVRLDQRRTASGLGSQLDILASGTRLLDARQAAANIAADAALRRVDLLVAAGGGFTAPTTIAARSEPRP